ncbi:MAG TPA: biotin transporter BioY [Ktedonobacterales bacterium]
MFSGARRLTLVDLARPQSLGAWWDVLLVVTFAALMGLCAQLSIPLPFTPVPITGQTFGVLLTAMLLGSWRGAAAMLAYLAEALAGLPVLANGASAWSPSVAPGVPVIAGPTAGYLLAFPVAALVVGALAERGWDRSVVLAIVAMVAGEAIIYLGGVTWLAHFVLTPGNALKLGLFPFLIGDAIKLGLVTLALPVAWRLQRAARRVS